MKKILSLIIIVLAFSLTFVGCEINSQNETVRSLNVVNNTGLDVMGIMYDTEIMYRTSGSLSVVVGNGETKSMPLMYNTDDNSIAIIDLYFIDSKENEYNYFFTYEIDNKEDVTITITYDNSGEQIVANFIGVGGGYEEIIRD